MRADFEKFIADVRDHFEQSAARMEDLVRHIAEGSEPRDVELADSLAWIIGKRDRSLDDKIAAIGKLIEAESTAEPGTIISLKELTGWK